MDLAGVALAKELLPFACGCRPIARDSRRSLVPAASRAAVGIGADGLIIEVHPCPERALSDGPQSLDLPGFAAMMHGLQDVMAMFAYEPEGGSRASPGAPPFLPFQRSHRHNVLQPMHHRRESGRSSDCGPSDNARSGQG